MKKYITLGEVCFKASSSIAQKDLQGIDGDYPIYGASGFIKNIDFYQQDKPYIAIVKDGAGIGRTMFLPAYSSVIGTMQYIIPKDSMDIGFLYYAIYFMNLGKYYSGATIPHIYFKDYQKELIPVFTRDKQESIVKILRSIDTLINHNNAQLLDFDLLVKSRFIEMFGNENQAFDNWRVGSVADIANVTVGVVIKPTQYYADKGVPAFRSLNIGEMKVKDEDWVYFTEEGHKKNPKSVIKENDVLVVRSGAPGVACVASEKYVGYNAVDIIIAHPNQRLINSVYMAMFTNMPHGMNQIRTKIGGAAQQHYNVGGYKSLKIALPPIEIQNQFADFVAQVDKSKLAVQQNLNELETLKKSLMQQYFG